MREWIRNACVSVQRSGLKGPRPAPGRGAMVVMATVAVGVLAALGPAVAVAGDAVAVLVLKEHGVATAAQAQPYIDKLVGAYAKQNGWAAAQGQYQTTRAAAETFIQDHKPHYGILSLAPFLAFRAKYGLDPVGTVSVLGTGGQQYFLVSKTAGDLAACKGKRLASDHADDPVFINKVVFAGKAQLTDFTLVTTTRPTQTLKKVVGGEADCALIDDAQAAQIGHIDGAADLKQVWASEKLPALVMVAFPSAPAAERKAFQASLPKLCEGDVKQACTEVGIQVLKPASASDFAAILAAYTK